MTAEPAPSSETAWELYNFLLTLINQLWETHELDFLMRFNQIATETAAPATDETTDLVFIDEDFPF